MKKVFKLTAITFAIFVIDYVSKALTNFYVQPMEYASSVYPFGGIPVFNFSGISFCLNNVANRGAAWGMFASLQDALLIFRIGVVLALLAYMFFSAKARQHHLPFTLIIAGALGNIIDYFTYGYVIDMFHFTFWGYSYPVFNVADGAIFCGVVWLILKSREHAAKTVGSS